MLLFYVVGAGVVFFGMKLVGVCEKYAVGAMVLALALLFVFTLTRQTQPLPTVFGGGRKRAAALEIGEHF